MPRISLPGSRRRSLSKEPRRSALTRRQRHRAARLLDQELWCLGIDITRAEGNLLIDFGFERERPLERDSGSTAYHREREGIELTVWGFGVYASSADGGLFIRRYGFRPLYCRTTAPPRVVWAPERLPLLRSPRGTTERQKALRLCDGLTKSLAVYERWLVEAAGVEYRRDCVRRWRKKAVVAGEDMASEWERLRCLDMA